MDNKTEVTIAGKTFNLTGYDSEYLKKVAAYINGKHEECMEKESFKRISFDLQSLFLQLNIADDYFSALDEIEQLKKKLEEKENEIYDIKHELVTEQMRHPKQDRQQGNNRQAQQDRQQGNNRQAQQDRQQGSAGQAQQMQGKQQEQYQQQSLFPMN